MLQKIGLDGFRYQPGHFNIKSYIVGQAIWKMVLRPENVIRMEAVMAVERPAVEALSEPLIAEFGRISPSPLSSRWWVIWFVMEALEYEVDRQRVRITRPGLFATGMTFRRPGQSRSRSVTVTAEHRREWLNAAETDEFNCWLNDIITKADGTTDLERLRSVAANWEVKLRGRNPILDRIELGIILRERVDFCWTVMSGRLSPTSPTASRASKEGTYVTFYPSRRRLSAAWLWRMTLVLYLVISLYLYSALQKATRVLLSCSLIFLQTPGVASHRGRLLPLSLLKCC